MGYQTITGSELIQIQLPVEQGEEVKLGVFSIWFGAFVVGATAVVSIAYPEQASHLVLLHLVLGVLTLTSFIFLAARFRDGVWLAAVPLLVNLGTFLLIATVPFASSWQTISFRWHQPSYAAMTSWAANQPEAIVAEMTNSGTMLNLPSRQQYLSEDGYVHIWPQGETAAYFFPASQTQTHINGYLYAPSGTIPTPERFTWQQITPYGRGWYYVVSGQ